MSLRRPFPPRRLQSWPGLVACSSESSPPSDGLWTTPRLALAQIGYLRPPKAVTDVLDAPPPPAVIVTPTREHLLLVQGVRYPPSPTWPPRCCGSPACGSTRRPTARTCRRGSSASPSQSIADGTQKQVNLPAGGHFGPPDLVARRQVVCLDQHDRARHRACGSATFATATIRRIDGVRLNAVYGEPIQWMSGSRRCSVKPLPAIAATPPVAPPVPPGPVVQESHGHAAPVRTFQDLLQNPHDEALFEYYATAQLALVDPQTGHVMPFGRPGIFADADPSPDGTLLLVERVHRPYSYLYPVSSFPNDIEIWDTVGPFCPHAGEVCRCRTRCRSKASRPGRETCIGGRRSRPRSSGSRRSTTAIRRRRCRTAIGC